MGKWKFENYVNVDLNLIRSEQRIIDDIMENMNEFINEDNDDDNLNDASAQISRYNNWSYTCDENLTTVLTHPTKYSDNLLPFAKKIEKDVVSTYTIRQYKSTSLAWAKLE